MNYEKPKVVAQNGSAGSFAAGCPEKNTGTISNDNCKRCERTR